MGVDPGLNVTGYGILQLIEGKITAKDYGVIRLPVAMPIGEKLCIIQQSLRELILHHFVEAMAVETQFVYKNVSSALKLGMVRGVALALAANLGVSTAEYAPTKIKKSVVGKGLASKKQMQMMVTLRLGLAQEPPEDAADAMAMALCHLQNSPLEMMRRL